MKRERERKREEREKEKPRAPLKCFFRSGGGRGGEGGSIELKPTKNPTSSSYRAVDLEEEAVFHLAHRVRVREHLVAWSSFGWSWELGEKKRERGG